MPTLSPADTDRPGSRWETGSTVPGAEPPPWGSGGPVAAAACRSSRGGSAPSREILTTTPWTGWSDGRTSPSSPTWSSPAGTASRVQRAKAPGEYRRVSRDREERLHLEPRLTGAGR